MLRTLATPPLQSVTDCIVKRNTDYLGFSIR